MLTKRRHAGSVGDELPELMSAWVHAWTRSRQTALPTHTSYGLRYEVGDSLGTVRRVPIDPSLPSLLEAVADSGPGASCIKLVGDPAIWRPRFPRTWDPDGDQWLMQGVMQSDVPQVPEGYQLSVRETSGRVEVTLTDSLGCLAASGQAGIHIGWAVPDLISTHPAHRRRGLGKVVMAEIHRAVMRQGADQALLVATPDGRYLYSSLGYRVVSPVTAAYLHRPISC